MHIGRRIELVERRARLRARRSDLAWRLAELVTELGEEGVWEPHRRWLVRRVRTLARRLDLVELELHGIEWMLARSMRSYRRQREATA